MLLSFPISGKLGYQWIMALQTHLQPPDDMVPQRRASLERALQKLDPLHKTVLIMKFFGHCSTTQIAIVLSCSVANVQVLQHQALIELQRIMS